MEMYPLEIELFPEGTRKHLCFPLNTEQVNKDHFGFESNFHFPGTNRFTCVLPV